MTDVDAITARLLAAINDRPTRPTADDYAEGAAVLRDREGAEQREASR